MRITLTILILSVLCAGTASAAPFAYVSNFRSSNVSVIDVSTNTVVDTVEVGGSPTGVAVSPDGAFVYVANAASNSNTVSVIRTSDNNVVDTVDVGVNPTGVAASPNSRRVYVTNQESNNVSVIKTPDNTEVATVDVGGSPFGVAITPFGPRQGNASGGGGSCSLASSKASNGSLILYLLIPTFILIARLWRRRTNQKHN